MVLALGGCTKKEEDKPVADSAADSAADSNDADAPVAISPKVAETIAKAKVPGVERLEHDEGILGHFALPNGSKLLTDVREQLVNPQYQNFLDEGALRSLVSMALEQRGMIAQNIDLSQPIGCAVVDFKTWKSPVSCTFGYKGGVKALLGDLGDAGRKADSGAHAAIYEIEGEQVFIDDLDGFVAIAGHDDLFKKTQGYLKTDIIGRGGAMVGDFEVVAYTGTIWKEYQAEIAELMETFNQASSAAPTETGNPKADAAIQKWMEYNKTSTKRSLDRLAQYDQVAAYINVTKTGLRFGFTAIPAAGSEVEKDAKLAGGRLVDPAFVKSLPAGSLVVAAFNTDPKAAETGQAREIRDLAVDTWTDLAGLDNAAAKASVEAYMKEGQGLYDGMGALAMFDQEGATFGAAAVQHLVPGASARDSWKAWSAKFTPEAVLGAEFSKFVTWEFTADASQSEGVPVDRWVIRPGAELEKKINEELAKDSEAKAAIDQFWGPIALTIDRAETNGNVVFTIAPKAEAGAMARVLKAQKGEGSLADDPGLRAIFGHSEAISGFMAVDAKATIDWLKGIEPIAAEMNKLPPNIGNDLSDIHLTSLYLPSGVSTFEYVFGQPLINQIKDLIEQG